MSFYETRTVSSGSSYSRPNSLMSIVQERGVKLAYNVSRTVRLYFNRSISQVCRKLNLNSEETEKLTKISNGKVTQKRFAEIKDAIKSPQFSKLRPIISSILSNMNEDTLNAFFIEIFREADVSLIPKLNSLISLQKIDAAASKLFPKVKDYMTTNDAQRVSDFVKGEYQSRQEEKMMKFLKMAKVYLQNIMQWIQDNFIVAFALNDIGGEVDDPVQATMRITMMITLWGTINTWIITLSSLLGSKALTAAVVSAGTLVGSAALIAYYKWFKPIPEHCYPFENISTYAAKNGTTSAVVQEGVVQQIVNVLKANTGSVRKFPLLVGAPGTGKSAIVRDMAAMMEAGQIPEFKDAKMFCADGTDLQPNTEQKVNKNRTVDNLTKFLKTMAGLNVIAFVDEIHALGPLMLEKLKTRLDAGPGGIKYFIGATTPKEYAEHIAGNYALERRLEIIPVGETDRKTTLLILKLMAVQEADDIDVAPGVYETLYYSCKALFPNLAQPAKAKAVLAKAFACVRSKRRCAEMEADLRNLKMERKVLANDYITANEGRTFTTDNNALYDKLKKKDDEVKNAEQALKVKMEEFDTYKKRRIQLNELKNDIRMMALKIAEGNVTDEYIKEYAFKQNYVKPALDQLIANQVMPEGSTQVDENLILDLLIEEIDNAEKSKKKTDPKLEEAYKNTKSRITELALKKDLSIEEKEELKFKQDYILPHLKALTG